MFEGMGDLPAGETYRLGMDFHGVLDACREMVDLANFVRDCGHEVHIVTGGLDSPEYRAAIKALGVRYSHFFSMSTHHVEIGTPMWYTTPDDPWMDEEVWNRTKAEYCARTGIHLHVDDSPVYGRYFTTPYIQFS